MINWQFFPKSKVLPDHLSKVIDEFEYKQDLIDSNFYNLNSNEVLETVRKGLENQGYLIEKSKKTIDKIKVPVLFGLNGKLEKYFEADGYNIINKTVLEVEAGRAVTNYQFLKDLFQASIMFDIDYLIIAVRNNYRGNPDFQNVNIFLDTLYVSDRLKLPLNGVLIIGY